MDDMIATTAEAYESSALPRIHEVHTDPAQKGASEQSLPKALKQPPGSKSPARFAYERIILYIRNFEQTLDNTHEVAMGFVGGDTGVIRIEGMGYFDPDLVTFYGSDMTGAKTQLIQHVTQLSVMLRALPKHIDQEAPRRIGFQLAKELEDSPAPAPDATT